MICDDCKHKTEHAGECFCFRTIRPIEEYDDGFEFCVNKEKEE